MNNSVMAWGAIAVLLFWSIGAYNRLMRLRSQGIAAFAALEALFNQHLLMVKTHFSDSGDDPACAARAGLAAAAEQFNASLKVARVQPLNGAVMSALKTAHETLSLSWSRLQDLPPDLAGPALPLTLQSEWEQVQRQAEAARIEFNRLVTNYNDAIAQFPAMMLATVFGFKPAQPI